MIESALRFGIVVKLRGQMAPNRELQVLSALILLILLKHVFRYFLLANDATSLARRETYVTGFWVELVSSDHAVLYYCLDFLWFYNLGALLCVQLDFAFVCFYSPHPKLTCGTCFFVAFRSTCAFDLSLVLASF